MAENLKQKTFSGLSWALTQNFSINFFAFVQGVILARILDPSDFGLIAMQQVFFAIAGVFIESGFGTALIQKKNRKAIDYSTVFVTNVCTTLFFALLLFFSAPYIASFYHEERLLKIVQANSVVLLLGALCAVQNTRMQIHLQFRQISIIHIITTVVAGIATIILAFLGLGVWALIYPTFFVPFLNFFL